MPYKNIGWSVTGRKKPTDSICAGGCYLRMLIGLETVSVAEGVPALRQGYAAKYVTGRFENPTYGDAARFADWAIGTLRPGTTHTFFEDVTKVGTDQGLTVYEIGMGS